MTSSSDSSSDTESLSTSSSSSDIKTTSSVSSVASSCKRFSKKKKSKYDKLAKIKKEKKIIKKRRKSKKAKLKSESLMKLTQRTCNADNEEAFGPILPPHLQQQKHETAVIVGPILSKELQTSTVINISPVKNDTNYDEDDVDNDADIYGPMPMQCNANSKVQMSAREIELEERALQLKMNAIDGGSLETKIKKDDVREEWMLELPDVGLKTGLASLANLKRGFHQGKEKPDFNDRTAWTKMPQSADADNLKNKKARTSKSAAQTLKNNAEELYQRQRDEEQERIAKKHKKKHKREESLVEIHKKKLRKEQKKKAKELAESGLKPERRPFTRDVDLKLNKIDKNQTKQIVDKAKILNTKFSTGKTKYL